MNAFKLTHTNLDDQLSLDSDAVAFISGYPLSSNIDNRCLPCGYVCPPDWRVGKRITLTGEPMGVEGRISQRAIQSSHRAPTNTTRACIVVMGEHREHFLRKFREMDIDNSGVLSKFEVKECLSAAGFDAKFIKKFMKRFDADGDGNITEDEYLRVVCNLPEEELKIAFWRSVFDDVDRDKSGRISCVELHNLLRDMGFPVKVSELEEWIRSHDKDEDGEMDFHEFVAFMSDTTH